MNSDDRYYSRRGKRGHHFGGRMSRTGLVPRGSKGEPREGGAKNEAQVFGLVPCVAGGIIHEDEKLRRGADWGGERAEVGFGHVECEMETSKWKCSVDSGIQGSRAWGYNCGSCF